MVPEHRSLHADKITKQRPYGKAQSSLNGVKSKTVDLTSEELGCRWKDAVLCRYDSQTDHLNYTFMRIDLYYT